MLWEWVLGRSSTLGYVPRYPVLTHVQWPSEASKRNTRKDSTLKVDSDWTEMPPLRLDGSASNFGRPSCCNLFFAAVTKAFPSNESRP